MATAMSVAMPICGRPGSAPAIASMPEPSSALPAAAAARRVRICIMKSAATVSRWTRAATCAPGTGSRACTENSQTGPAQAPWPAGRPGRPLASLARGAFLFLALIDAGRKGSLDEGVNVAVQHVLRGGMLDTRAQVLDQLIGLQHVGTDLVAPADIGLRRGGSVGLGFALLQLFLI